MRSIIVGGGKLVYFLSRTLTSKGHKVTVINSDRKDCEDLAKKRKIDVIHGDGSEPEVLEDAGAFYTDSLMALTPYDQVNFNVCQIANAYFQIPRIVALVNDPDNEEVFKKLGVAEAISVTHILTGLIEQTTIFEDIITHTPVGKGKVSISEIPLKKTAKVINLKVLDMNLPKDCLIAGVIRKGDTIIPRGNTRLRRGDRVVLVSLAKNHQEALKVLSEEY